MNIGQNRQAISIASTAAGAAHKLLAGASGRINFLNELNISLSGAGSVKVQSYSTSTGSTAAATDLSGNLTATANNLFVTIPPRLGNSACLQSTSGACLQLVSTGVTFSGYAIASYQ